MAIDVESISFGIIAVLLLASGIAAGTVKRTFHSVMFLGVFLVAVAALYVLLGSPLVGVIQVLVYVGGILTLFVFAVMFVAGDETETEAPAPLARPRGSLWSVLAAVAIAAVLVYVAFAYVGTVNHAAQRLGGAHMEATATGGEDWVTNNWAITLGFVAGVLFWVVLAVVGIVAWIAARRILDTWTTARILGTGLAATLAVLMAVSVLGAAAWAGMRATDASVGAANDLDRVVDALFNEHAVALEVLGVLLTAVMIGALVLARPLRAPADEDAYARVTREQVRQAQMVSDPHARGPLAPPSAPVAPVGVAAPPAPSDPGSTATPAPGAPGGTP